eukprot:m.501740 g.501740  ORF g.501740 m.501740 type:complete len:553 (+) comp21841_c0_seq1:236-1894(+)
MELDGLKVGDEALLEGTHKCVVRYVGKLPVGIGIWYGVEMKDASLGKNNGAIGDAAYFSCTKPRSGLFVRRSRLSAEAPSRSPSLEIPSTVQSIPMSHQFPVSNNVISPSLRPCTAPETLSMSDLETSSSGTGTRASSKLQVIQSNSILHENPSTKSTSNSLAPSSSGTKQHQRTRSSVNPREVEQAIRQKDSKKMTKTEKRNRNKTLAGPEFGSASLNESMGKFNAQQARESDMRKEIMQLQKEHLKTLIAENKHLTETNELLLAHVAHIESEHSKVSLENIQIKERLESVQTQELLEEIISERDLAVEKLAELSSNLETVQEENKRLRRALREGNVDVTNCFANDEETPLNSHRGARVDNNGQQDVHEMVARTHELAARAEHLQKLLDSSNTNKAEQQAVVDALTARCTQADERLERMATLVQRLTAAGGIPHALSSDVHHAAALHPRDHGEALHALAARINWDDIDEEQLLAESRIPVRTPPPLHCCKMNVRRRRFVSCKGSPRVDKQSACNLSRRLLKTTLRMQGGRWWEAMSHRSNWQLCGSACVVG